MEDFQIKIESTERDEFLDFCCKQSNIKKSDYFSNIDSSLSNFITCIINSHYARNNNDLFIDILVRDSEFHLDCWRDYSSYKPIKTFNQFKQLFNKTSNLELSKVEKDNSIVSKLIVKHFFKQTLTKQDVVDFIKDYEETI